MAKYRRREDLTDREVIDGNAKKVGTIKDLAFTDDGKVVLVLDIVTEKGSLKEAFVPFQKVEKMGDIVLIKSAEDLDTLPLVEKICPNCRGKNPLDSKFCFSCGVTLPER